MSKTLVHTVSKTVDYVSSQYIEYKIIPRESVKTVIIYFQIDLQHENFNSARDIENMIISKIEQFKLL